ncbi:hypothetical protein FB451DRAFT_1186711 [Mycena latifolia]|nr:hypothetical protein FB451DRAFT_1186711 [Mycena latifolia]
MHGQRERKGRDRERREVGGGAGNNVQQKDTHLGPQYCLSLPEAGWTFEDKGLALVRQMAECHGLFIQGYTAHGFYGKYLWITIPHSWSSFTQLVPFGVASFYVGDLGFYRLPVNLERLHSAVYSNAVQDSFISYQVDYRNVGSILQFSTSDSAADKAAQISLSSAVQWSGLRLQKRTDNLQKAQDTLGKSATSVGKILNGLYRHSTGPKTFQGHNI